MLCPNCHQPITPGSVFCGNCGFQLNAAAAGPQQTDVPPQTGVTPDTATPTSQPPVQQPVSNPPAGAQPQIQPMVQPAYGAAQAPIGAATAVGAQPGQVTSSKRETEAGLALGLGILGCVAWILMLLLGIILGILAIVFGTISMKSKHKIFARVGIVLGIIALTVSLFITVQRTQKILKDHSLTSSTSDSSTLQTVSTPCYTTKIPSNLTINRSSDSCNVQAINTKTQEQYMIEIQQAAGLTAANLDASAEQGTKSATNLEPGSYIASQQSSSFAGSPAYLVKLSDNNGAAGEVDFIYHVTEQGNFVMIIHAAPPGQQYNLDTIENNWSWE